MKQPFKNVELVLLLIQGFSSAQPTRSAKGNVSGKFGRFGEYQDYFDTHPSETTSITRTTLITTKGVSSFVTIPSVSDWQAGPDPFGEHPDKTDGTAVSLKLTSAKASTFTSSPAGESHVDPFGTQNGQTDTSHHKNISSEIKAQLLDDKGVINNDNSKLDENKDVDFGSKAENTSKMTTNHKLKQENNETVKSITGNKDNQKSQAADDDDDDVKSQIAGEGYTKSKTISNKNIKSSTTENSFTTSKITSKSEVNSKPVGKNYIKLNTDGNTDKKPNNDINGSFISTLIQSKTKVVGKDDVNFKMTDHGDFKSKMLNGQLISKAPAQTKDASSKTAVYKSSHRSTSISEKRSLFPHRQTPAHPQDVKKPLKLKPIRNQPNWTHTSSPSVIMEKGKSLYLKPDDNIFPEISGNGGFNSKGASKDDVWIAKAVNSATDSFLEIVGHGAFLSETNKSRIAKNENSLLKVTAKNAFQNKLDKLGKNKSKGIKNEIYHIANNLNVNLINMWMPNRDYSLFARSRSTMKIFLESSSRYPVPLPENHMFCHNHPSSALCRTFIG